MSLNTLRKCFTLVTCQFERLRLLPTIHAMNAPLDTGGRKAIDCIAAHAAKLKIYRSSQLVGKCHGSNPSVSFKRAHSKASQVVGKSQGGDPCAKSKCTTPDDRKCVGERNRGNPYARVECTVLDASYRGRKCQ